MQIRVLVTLLVVALAVPGQAQVPPDAVCATNMVSDVGPSPRYFCEAMDSVGFVQFDQFVAGLAYLEDTHPDFIEVKVIGESVEGLPIYFVEVTNELSATPRADKLQIGYSASIHANEAAGREGMTRMIEDLVAGIGPHGAELRPLLDDLIVNVWFPNPDSWASGDFFDADGIAGLHSPADGTGFARENALGVDLNREFPNPGWIEPPHTPMSEPESRAVVEELRFSGNHSNLAAGTDLHGMINSANMIRMIIPNQDYDLRRMVLIVDQLHLVQDRVEADPAYAEWTSVDEVISVAEGIPLPVCPEDPIGLVANGCIDSTAVHDKPMQWGARWDMIGYTDTGFTSDYLTLSPRSPTGGMGAVGTITEFAYSHMVPDNKYVAKLTDMHVAGVRQIVRTQMEMTLRLDSPMLVGTGPVAYVDDGVRVSSDFDANPYVAESGKDFDLADARFDFNQVDYDVTNLRFWSDLDRFSQDPIEALPATSVSRQAFAPYESLVITNQALDALDQTQVTEIRDWVEEGGHLLLTDSALRFLDQSGLTSGAVAQQCVYVGHSELEAMDHPLLTGVDWGARVTGEASAVGFKANQGSDWNYPEWGIDRAAFEGLGGEVVGMTTGHAPTGDSCLNERTDALVTLGHVQVGSGSIDVLGGALPLPTQLYDHRYGLADYSVSALTYWVVMNSLGGHIEYQAIDQPFVPTYDFDPIYGKPVSVETEGKQTPFLPMAFLLIGLAIVARRR